MEQQIKSFVNMLTRDNFAIEGKVSDFLLDLLKEPCYAPLFGLEQNHEGITQSKIEEVQNYIRENYN